MANVIKLHKGLDINLKGKAEEKKIQLKSSGKYALMPADFEGVVPKVVVKEGDKRYGYRCGAGRQKKGAQRAGRC